MLRSAYRKETDKSFGIFRRGTIDQAGNDAFIVEVMSDCSGKQTKAVLAELTYSPLEFNSYPTLMEAVKLGRKAIQTV